MSTLAEVIAPNWFEVAATFPRGLRDVAYKADEAIATARAWIVRGTHCVQVTAYGTTGTPGRDQSFALRNFEWVDGEILDSGWRGWMGAGKFIGPLED